MEIRATPSPIIAMRPKTETSAPANPASPSVADEVSALSKETGSEQIQVGGYTSGREAPALGRFKTILMSDRAPDDPVLLQWQAEPVAKIFNEFRLLEMDHNYYQAYQDALDRNTADFKELTAIPSHKRTAEQADMIQADLYRMTDSMRVLKGGEPMKAIKARLDELAQQFEALRGTEAFVAWEKVYNADGALAAPGAPLAVRDNPTLPFGVPNTASGTEADAVQGELGKLGLMALVEKIKNTAEQGAATGIMAG